MLFNSCEASTIGEQSKTKKSQLSSAVISAPEAGLPSRSLRINFPPAKYFSSKSQASLVFASLRNTINDIILTTSLKTL